MDFKEKLYIISDDNENKLVNQFYNNLENTNIELISSKSDIDDLKSNMKWDNFVILIDYDNLNSDINQLIRLIRSYLHSLPFIGVISSDTSIFNRKELDHAYYIDKSWSFESIYDRLVNFIKVMKFSKLLNDVSHLPGNSVINEIMKNKLENNEDFVIMYIDIDQFKSFCDYYGVYRSSKVVQFLTKTIIDLFEKYELNEDFIGHVGGDDFVLIFHNYENYKFIGNKIIEEFDKNIVNFYDKTDVERNYIEVLNRKGIMQKFNIVSLSIISITNKVKDYSNTTEIYKDMMILKKDAKQTMGSILLHSDDKGGI